MAEKVDLFLSYARGDDEQFVQGLFVDLTARGFTVWWDRASMLTQGHGFLQEIRDAIEGCDRLIAVLGPKALESHYVRAEWEHALLLAKGVIPILRLEDSELVPPDLRKLRCSDCRPCRPYAEALAELCQILTEPI